ncbi:hypothetical protein Tco_1035781 [Tanacetum coccineum]
MANNETYTYSPSEVCLSDSESELLIPTPWFDEFKNEKRVKGWRQEFEWKRSLFEIDFMFDINAFDLDKGTDVMKDKVSQEHVCEEEVPLNNNIGKQIGNFVDIPSEAVKQGMMLLALLLLVAKGTGSKTMLLTSNLEFQCLCKEVANPHVNETSWTQDEPLTSENGVIRIMVMLYWKTKVQCK